MSGRARVEDRSALAAEIRRVQPSRVLCLAGIAGRPDISWCDSNKAETVRVNLLGQLNVADVAAREMNGLHCTLITSGGIYTYDNDQHRVTDGKAFTELDEPNYKGKFFYYDMRIALERLLNSAYAKNVLVLRIMYPATRNLDNPRSLLGKLIKYETVKSVPISVSILDDLWPVLVDMVTRSISGTFNFNNPGTITHERILQLYREHVKPDHKWQSAPFDGSRPAAELSAQRLVSLGYSIPTVEESIKMIMIANGPQQTNVDLDSHYLTLMNIHSLGTESLKIRNIMITGGAGFIGSLSFYFNFIMINIKNYLLFIKNFNSKSRCNSSGTKVSSSV